MVLLKSLGWRHIQSVPSGLQGYIREDIYSVGQETGVIIPLLTITLRVHSICSQYSIGTFQLGMLDRGNVRVSPNGVGPRHVAYCIKGVWEDLLQGNDVLDHCF